MNTKQNCETTAKKRHQVNIKEYFADSVTIRDLDTATVWIPRRPLVPLRLEDVLLDPKSDLTKAPPSSFMTDGFGTGI